MSDQNRFFYYTEKLAKNNWFWFGYLIAFGINIPDAMEFTPLSFILGLGLILLTFLRYRS